LELKALKKIYRSRKRVHLFKALVYPNPFLESEAAHVDLPVSEFDVAVLTRMKEVMTETDGKKTRLVCVGLAAPQIGVAKQMFLYCPASPSSSIASKVSRDLIAVFNPEILGHGKEETILHEGCVSDPNFFAPVKRYRIIEVRYFDRNGEAVYRKLTGWEARVFQHEVDHLRGILCRFRHQELSAGAPASKSQ